MTLIEEILFIFAIITAVFVPIILLETQIGLYLSIILFIIFAAYIYIHQFKPRE